MPQWLRDTIMFIFIMGCAESACASCCLPAMTTTTRLPPPCSFWRWCSSRAYNRVLARHSGVGRRRGDVNYLFTYPFHEFGMSIDGYPLTFAVMLVVKRSREHAHDADQRQEQLRYEAERDRMRVNLLRSVSHDIRTPLTAIMGLSATVEEKTRRSRTRGHGMVEEIHQERAVAAAPVGEHSVRYALLR